MVEPAQVRFTLHLTDQRSKWMQDGWKVHMDSYMASNSSCFMVTWTIIIYQQAPLGARPNTKPRDHDTPDAHHRWFMLFYHVWWPTWMEIHWNSSQPEHIWLHTTLEGPWPHYMIMEVCWDDGLWTLSFGLSQPHRHGSWLVSEVTLSYIIFFTHHYIR